MNTEKSLIWVTFSREGVHCYPAALTDPSLKDVSFLGYPHRHMFHFKVYIEVFHDDRELEFILVKRWLESLYNGGAMSLNNQSCEMIARDLHEAVITRYPGREVWIEVSEDHENGCFIKFPQTI